MTRRAGIVAALALMQACAGPGTTECSSGRICPRGLVCAEEHDRCVLESQVNACDGRSNGAACGFAEVDQGECDDGVCFAVACGNEIQQSAEMCDDGNRVNGDGCNAQCTSDETCGNDFIDLAGSEICDGMVAADGPNCVETFHADRGLLTCKDDCTAAFEVCSFIGWRIAGNPGFLGTLSGVWRGGGGIGFTVGEGGTILAEDLFGSVFMDSGTTAWLRGVWGSGPDDAFIVGDGGTILHFDGTGWSPMASGTALGLAAVWGSGADDVVAVGEGGTILHFDGESWSSTSSPTGEWLRGVWAAGPEDVFAVGDGGTILHLDEGGWSAMTSGTTAALAGVWGAGPDDVFAVGSGGTIVHYDGVDWAVTSSPTDESLTGVWGTRSDQIFVAAANSTILAYDGVGWANILLGAPDPVPGQLPAFTAVAGIEGAGADQVFAVGEFGLMYEHSGTSWGNWPQVSSEQLHAMWSPGPGDLFVFGSGGTVLRRDGSTWSVAELGIDPGLTLVDAWGTGPDNVYAVADFLSVLLSGPAGPPPGLFHFDGTSWSAIDSGVVGALYGVWGSGPDDVFAVGPSGAIVHHDGTGWEVMDSGSIDWLTAIWGSGSDDVFAVGANGRILHYDGTSWSAMVVDGVEYDDSGFSPVYFLDVWGSGPDDVFAIAGSQIFHYDGTGWSHVALGGDELVLEEVGGTGADDVFVTGRENRIYHYDGVGWSRVRVHLEAGTDPLLPWTSLWATPEGVFIASDTGLIQELIRFQPW
jgi:cysteine-rich repeat protein